MQNDILELNRFILELTLSRTPGADLGGTLENVLTRLSDFPSLHLKAQGAILLYNPAHRPIQVAQRGIPSAWSAGFSWEMLRDLDQSRASDIRFLVCAHAAASPTAVSYAGQRFCALPLVDDGKCLGHVALFLAGEAVPDAALVNVLADLARAMSSIVVRCLLDEVVQVREWELEESRTEAIHRLGAASEYRDNDTGWHVMRMTNFALAIAKQMQLPEEKRELLFVAAPMHDVGKIGIPDSILLKPGRLDAEEIEIMRRHTEIGEVILKGNDTLISTAREIAATHHERWDGQGYPRQLRGEEIPILARICAVADVFDALTSSRPYKTAWSVTDALEWIYEQSGSQFDPVVIDAFRAALPEIMRIRELYRDDIIDPTQVLTLPPPEEKEQRWVTWDESLSVGIDVIDEHHRHLFDLVNEIFDVVSNSRGARAIARELKALDLYAKVHFRAEERMMEHYGFSGTARQRNQHRRFEEKLREFHDELHVNPLTAQYDVLEFARNWLTAHIFEEDTQLRELVKAVA